MSVLFVRIRIAVKICQDMAPFFLFDLYIVFGTVVL
eukprot:SAG11_NODE_2553_length_3225_cov_2.342610_2_plen_36_part_00